MKPQGRTPVARTRGFSLPALLLSSALVAAVAVAGFEVLHDTSLRIEPHATSALIGDTITVQVFVDASSPVNVFAGDILFDPQVLSVKAISYNTSIADLWVTKPWYDNGAGTLNFGGGTTKPGGFTGTGALLNISFRTIAEGNGAVTLENGRILRHDGMGTDVPLTKPIDSVITVLATSSPQIGTTRVLVTNTPLSPDVNGDGKVTFADASSMMLNLFGNNPRYDLNHDGRIDRTDLDIVLEAR